MRIFPGTQITRTGTFKDSNGDVTDPTSVKYFYKIENGDENEVTPSKVSTGIYNAVYTPEIGGKLWERWEGEGVGDLEDWFPVTESQFNDYNV
jgi:hypothetical protein